MGKLRKHDMTKDLPESVREALADTTEGEEELPDVDELGDVDDSVSSDQPAPQERKRKRGGR